MRTFFTLAYPTLSDQHANFIDEVRRRHDEHHALARAHFTMAFGLAGVDERAYLAHVRDVATRSPPIAFVCRYAMLGADDARAYAFLVPDEGFSGIARLHDALYRGILAPYLRLDLPYVPHITLGASVDRPAMKACCDALNQRALSIQGNVEALTVAVLQDGGLSDIATFPLGSSDG